MNDYVRFVGSETITYLKDARQVSGVSRIIPTKSRSYDSVLFMQGRPILDSEINLLQQIMTSKISKLATGLLSTGWTAAPPVGYDSSGPTKAEFTAFDLFFNGTFLTIDDGNGRCLVDMGPSIQQMDRIDYILTYIYKEELAAPGEGTRLREQIKKYGNLNGANLLSDIMDPALPTALPTTHRLQTTYRNMSCSVAQFATLPAVDSLGRISQDYSFDYYDTTQGYYRAGDGSIESAEILGTADGYVYMIPLFRVNRQQLDQIVFGNKLDLILPRFKLRTGMGASDSSVEVIPLIGLEAATVQKAIEDIYESHSTMLDHIDGFYNDVLIGFDKLSETLAGFNGEGE